MYDLELFSLYGFWILDVVGNEPLANESPPFTTNRNSLLPKKSKEIRGHPLLNKSCIQTHSCISYYTGRNVNRKEKDRYHHHWQSHNFNEMNSMSVRTLVGFMQICIVTKEEMT